MSCNIPIVSFVGFSGSGKTTFIEKVIPELKLRNIRLAVIKHDAHHFTIDKEGKDTWRFAKAGADIVSISSSEKLAIIEQTNRELTLEEITSNTKGVDLIITEGYRAGKAPKIGVYRKVSGIELSLPHNELTAVVSDVKVEAGIPCYDIEDVKGVADFLQDFILKGKYPTWVSLEEARELLLNLPQVEKNEYISLDKASGRVLAQDIIAQEMIPQFSKSPLDGYAFRSEDTKNASSQTPVTFSIIEEVPAGTQPTLMVKPGTATKILTGSPIPDGADAVTRYEDTEFSSSDVTIFKEFMPNTNIVFAGDDIKIGDKVADKGSNITPPIAGLLASLGVSNPLVYKKPVITLINTGDELIKVNEPILPAKIRNSSFYTISGYLEQAGAIPLDGGIAKDTAEEIARLIKVALLHSDMIITTGGVSVGDYDMVRNALDLLGAKTLFWKIKIKPGSAVIAATLDNKLILGLSGNPASAIVTLQLLGMPFINKLTGKEIKQLEKTKVIMLEPFEKASPKGRYIRGRLVIIEGIAYFEQNESQSNGAISSLKDCNLIGEIKPGTSSLNKGDMIEAYWINS